MKRLSLSHNGVVESLGSKQSEKAEKRNSVIESLRETFILRMELILRQAQDGNYSRDAGLEVSPALRGWKNPLISSHPHINPAP